MNSITDAKRGKSITVDSRLQQEIHDLNGIIGGLHYDIKREKESHHFWRFTAIVTSSFALLLVAVIVDYLYL